MTPETLARIMARHHLTRGDLVIITVFGYGHPETSVTQAVWDYLHGVGPAAAAAGRAVAGGVRLAPQRVETVGTIAA